MGQQNFNSKLYKLENIQKGVENGNKKETKVYNR